MPQPAHLAAVVLSVAATAAVTTVTAGPAVGKTTDTATLRCGSQRFTVDGFGRGQVLHVTGTTRNYIVTRAVRHSPGGDEVVIDSPSQADRDLVTCSTTTPGPDGVGFTFAGFFTPAG